MLQKNDMARVYETVLSIPGMNEKIKLGLLVSRKNILLLNKIIERGLSVKESDEKSISILDIISADSLQELKDIGSELLNKSGLSDMNEKLKSF